VLPQWERLAAGHSFYVSPDWLEYADRVGRPGRYHLASGGDGVTAALSAHCVPGESPEYDPRSALGPAVGPAGSGTAADSADSAENQGPVLTLGGRRGFRSGLLLEGPDTSASLLAGLLGAALDAEPAAEGRWWWPYLTLDEALTAGTALRTAGVEVELHHLGADCVIDLVGAGPEDHLAALPLRQRRTNARRELRRFADSGLRLEAVPLEEHAEALAPLLAQVQNKYGHGQTVAELATLLRAQAEALGRYAVTLVCRDDERTLGFSLCYRWGDELAVRVVGFDYAALRDADEYAQLVVHGPLAYCYRTALRRLHLGIDSWEAKCRRGARLRALLALTAPAGSRRWPAGAPLARLDALSRQVPKREADLLRAEVGAGLARAHTAGLAAAPPTDPPHTLEPEPASHPDDPTGQP
jgi:hypothetical protein